MNGPSTEVGLVDDGMLTAFVTMPPSSAATTCSATITPARPGPRRWRRRGAASRLPRRARAAAPCTARRRRRRAPRLRASDRIASTSASSSTSALRAALTRRAPSRIAAIASRSMRRRVVGERRVERDDVGGAEQLLHGLRLLDAEVTEALAPDERVVGDDAHREPIARRATCWPMRRSRSRRVSFRELDAAPARPPQRPCFSAAWACGMLRASATTRPIVLRGRDDGGVGGVRDDDPAPRRRVDVDVVDPDPGPADHLEAARASITSR